MNNDAAKIHFLSLKGIYIEPPYLREHRNRMKQIKDSYDKEMEDIENGISPTKYGFEVWNMYEKAKNKNEMKLKLLTFVAKLLKIELITKLQHNKLKSDFERIKMKNAVMGAELKSIRELLRNT